MNKYLRKSLYIGLSALIIAGLGASVSSNTYASINPDRYGIDVFPSKKTHNWFAYQLRRHGHNSHIYYATKNSRVGRAIFDHSNPNIDYADYMMRYHYNWYNSITKRLESHIKAKKVSHKAIRKHHRVIKRARGTKHVEKYNRKIHMNHKRSTNRKRKDLGAKVLRSRFKRSNNRRALKQSGYFNARAIGGDFIFNKYAPNDKQAVVPKNFKETNWYKGKFGQLDPTAYYYESGLHVWIKLK